VQVLIAKHRLIENLVHRQGEGASGKAALVESLTHRQNLADLQKRIDSLDAADVAYILEGLPLEDRILVWSLVRSDRDGESPPRSGRCGPRNAARGHGQGGDRRGGAQPRRRRDRRPCARPPEGVVQDILEAKGVEDRAQLQSALSYPEGTVGALMDFDVVSIREDVTVETALRYLRRFDELPGTTDALWRRGPG
jgi:magnesium transporter